MASDNSSNDKEIKLEFAVQVKNEKCLADIRESVRNLGKVIDLELNGRLVIETTKPWTEIQNQIEKDTKKRAVLTGSGGASAVAMIEDNKNNVKGVVRFCASSATENGSVVDGVVDGLQGRTAHNLSVCEFGDLSKCCENLGSVYKNYTYKISSDENGRSVFRFYDHQLNVSDLIGRSVLVSENDKKLTCGIIARSAGIFENFKRICACDGVVIWDERDRPLTGPGRRVIS